MLFKTSALFTAVVAIQLEVWSVLIPKHDFVCMTWYIYCQNDLLPSSLPKELIILARYLLYYIQIDWCTWCWNFLCATQSAVTFDFLALLWRYCFFLISLLRSGIIQEGLVILEMYLFGMYVSSESNSNFLVLIWNYLHLFEILIGYTSLACL